MLIGLSGFKRAGKDTVARGLCASGWRFRCHAFGDALRDEVRAVYGVFPVDDRLKDEPNPVTGRTYRSLLIELGAKRRQESAGYWVEKLERGVTLDLWRGLNVVISDCRFDNEIDWVRRAGGVMVWIYREGIVSNGHITERDLSRVCDIQLHNDGSHPGVLAWRLHHYMKAWRAGGLFGTTKEACVV